MTDTDATQINAANAAAALLAAITEHRTHWPGQLCKEAWDAHLEMCQLATTKGKGTA
jgi:hypothetical protein